MIYVLRYIDNGSERITEFLLEKTDKAKTFETVEAAKDFLKSNGLTEAEINQLDFKRGVGSTEEKNS